MTLEKAKKIIKSECYIADLLNLDRTRMVNTALDTVIEAAEETRWIPCSERLPEDGEKIIVYGKRYFIPDHSDELDWKYATWIITFHKWLLDEHEIIAWMPLPQPYKAEGSDTE